MILNKKHSIFWLLLVWSSFSAMAQAKFYAKGSKTAYVGHSYSLSFVLENAKGKLQIPQQYEGFQLIGGPSTSQNYQWINGKTTSSTTYTYYLQADKEGTYTIPSAKVEVNGETLQTEAFEVKVIKGAPPQQQQRNRNWPFPNRRQQQTPPKQDKTEDNNWQDQAKKNLFVRMYADKTSPYVGEQITVYLKLYQRINAYGMQIAEMPEFEGFWKHDFQLETENQWKQEQIDGVWYKTLMINKYALFPLREGKFTINPLKMQAVLLLQESGNTGDPFFDQFFGKTVQKEYNFQSASLNVNVKPLPIEGKPADFSGAVGQFRFKAHLDSLSAYTGNAIKLRTSITGTGNLMMIDAPQFSLPENFELFDPEEKEYISKKSSKINGTKKYAYDVIVHQPDTYQLNPLQFSYFDLKSKKYKTIYSDTLSLTIKPSEEYLAEQAKNTPVVEESKEEKMAFLPIATTNDLNQKRESYFVEKKWFWLWSSTPAFLLLLLVALKKPIENYEPDPIARNRKKANRLALKKLKQAQVFLKKQDQKAFYNEVIRSLWNYVALKINIDKEHLSKDNIQEKLLAHQADQNTAQEYVNLIEKCEMAVYAPIQHAQMQNDFNEAKELIIKLESVL